LIERPDCLVMDTVAGDWPPGLAPPGESSAPNATIWIIKCRARALGGESPLSAVAAPLPNGDVLLAGGDGCGGSLAPAALFKTARQAVVSGGDFGDQTVAQPSAANPICRLIFAPGSWTVQGQTGRTAFFTVALGGRAWSMAG
jgi:hypothetical protein